MTDDRIFRVSDKVGYHNEGIPWSVIAPHARTARSNHGQSLERLHERGGLSWSEAAAVLEDRPYFAMHPEAAKQAVMAHVAARKDQSHDQ